MEISWGRCADIFAGLTQEQRSSLTAVASDNAGSLSFGKLMKLSSLGLIHIDDFGIALTANGRLVASFC
jgi:hypothetical protein